MLSDADKERLRTEEIFRSEVRDQLQSEKASSRGSIVWKFLNSGLFLWFLGSVVVTGIVAWKDAQDATRAATSLERKLDIEIAARVHRLRDYMSRLESQGTPLNVADVLRSTGPISDQPYPMGVFSEYDERTLESLLWELSLVTNNREQRSILDALHSSKRLREMGAEITVQTPDDRKLEYISRVYKELDDSFGLSRWNLPGGR